MAGRRNYAKGKGPPPTAGVYEVPVPETAEPKVPGTAVRYSEEVEDELLALVASGLSLYQIEKIKGMPSRRSVLAWKYKYPDFSRKFDAARLAGVDSIAEDILNIADDGSNDWVERLGYNGATPKMEVNGEAIHRSKLRVESRKWLLAKLMPKKYGDKVSQEVSGADGGPIRILSSTVKFVDPKPQ